MANAAAVWQARKLLRDARSATLATVSDGQPFASLVTPACAPDLSVLMLLSSLSEHTRQLLANPRCAVMVVGEAADANPQTAPRLTVSGQAVHVEDAALLRVRWVARHPYAAFYAGFGDFGLFRLQPESGQFIGGFASAHRLQQAELTPAPEAVRDIAVAEASIIAEMNADHADAMARMAGSPGWRMTAVDVDGCDLAREETVLRIAWSAPVADAYGVRRELIRLARDPA
jgi:putative heme iron utilization protein